MAHESNTAKNNAKKIWTGNSIIYVIK